MEGVADKAPDPTRSTPPFPIDADTAARMIAVLCASILGSAAGEKDHVKVLATSDIYLDFIRPRALHVTSAGDVSFEPGSTID